MRYRQKATTTAATTATTLTVSAPSAGPEAR